MVYMAMGDDEWLAVGGGVSLTGQADQEARILGNWCWQALGTCMLWPYLSSGR